ncbi:MAG: hypothetical protein ABFC97_02560 [Anaerolineaceae bacterium]
MRAVTLMSVMIHGHIMVGGSSHIHLLLVHFMTSMGVMVSRHLVVIVLDPCHIMHRTVVFII